LSKEKIDFKQGNFQNKVVSKFYCIFTVLQGIKIQAQRDECKMNNLCDNVA